MKQGEFSRRFTLIIMLLLSQYDQLVAQTNLCPTFSCNCTYNSSGVLNIICSSSANNAILPTLTDAGLHGSVTHLNVKPDSTSPRGPLNRLPTNLCSVYPNVQILDFSNNQISDFVNTTELACLGSKLTSIDLSHNFITEINRNFFQANTQLQKINLSYNNLTKMPSIDADMFVNFPRTMTSMDFSFNAITSADLWPLFVKTGTTITIDMHDNLISSFVNEVPIYVKQFEETPDPRLFYLNNNLIDRLSDYIIQQYGACATLSDTSIAYFVVGISNLLVTGNPLICDCDSYFLITYIQDRMNQFPDINGGTALINQATCDSPPWSTGTNYVSFDFNSIGGCDGFRLNSTVNKFCSIYSNDTSATLAPPNYWTSTTVRTTVGGGGGGGGGNSSGSGGSDGSSNNGTSGSSSSSTPAWYIILGIVLGVAIILAVVTTVCYWFRDRILPEKCRSKLGIRGRNGISNGVYHPMFSGSDADSHDGYNSAQGTQTGLPIERVKPNALTGGAPKRKAQPIDGTFGNQKNGTARKLSASKATDTSTNTDNIVRGIPIGSSKPPKVMGIPSNANDTSTSELSVKSIPMGASKRAKLLPQVKSGMYVDTNNVHLLNTSAGMLGGHQRQRRRSAAWLRKQAQVSASPLPARPRSMVDQKTSFDHEGSFDQDLPPIPTIESLTDTPAKPLRTLPLLNITVVPAWLGDEDAEVAAVTGTDDTMKKE